MCECGGKLKVGCLVRVTADVIGDGLDEFFRVDEVSHGKDGCYADYLCKCRYCLDKDVNGKRTYDSWEFLEIKDGQLDLFD